ncbi:MAG: glycosyltransferase [Promethearchaeota archaeon]|jgi:cellulose synthase/poly-beta-1,6-N-acetylglucosamine synthase-like glycosyltransferase
MKPISQSNKIKISVIIPTYNEAVDIKNTLIAIKNQVCNFPYEIIVSDGQSSDKTVSIAKEFAKVYISPQKGKSLQLNYVVPKASGDLFIFLDADTIIKPYFLQKINRIFEKRKKLFACSVRVKYYDGRAISINLGSRSFTVTRFFFLNTWMHIYYFCKNLLGFPELSGSNIIVRREIFYKVGGFKQLPSNLIGMDKVFSDALLYLIRKLKFGKITTLNFLSVFTSGRSLSIRRSLGRVTQYHSEKDIFNELSRDTSLKGLE